MEVIDPIDEPESEPSRECFDAGVSSELFEFREQDCIFDSDSSSDSGEEQENQQQTITSTDDISAGDISTGDISTGDVSTCDVSYLTLP